MLVCKNAADKEKGTIRQLKKNLAEVHNEKKIMIKNCSNINFNPHTGKYNASQESSSSTSTKENDDSLNFSSYPENYTLSLTKLINDTQMRDEHCKKIDTDNVRLESLGYNRAKTKEAEKTMAMLVGRFFEGKFRITIHFTENKKKEKKNRSSVIPSKVSENNNSEKDEPWGCIGICDFRYKNIFQKNHIFFGEETEKDKESLTKKSSSIDEKGSEENSISNQNNSKRKDGMC